MASTTTRWILELVDKLTSPLQTATDAAMRMTETVDDTTESVEHLGRQAQEQTSILEKFGKGMFFLNEIKDGVDNIRDSFTGAIQPGINFQYALAQVQAISGLTNDKMKLVSDNARQLAKDFGVDAAQGAGVFTNILSQLGPEMALFPDVLNSMATNAFTLSKTMEGDVNGAISALTTSFNAFDLQSLSPIESAKAMTAQMNIIAKSAQVGAAEVNDIASSLSTLGKYAYFSGVSFEETNAALQVLGQNTIKGSEAGTGLRNVLNGLAVQTPKATELLQAAGVNIDLLHDKSRPLVERLEQLKPILQNDAAMTAMFGVENKAAALALISGTDSLRGWTEEVQGSNSATEQAAIIMDTHAEKMKRMQAWVDDLKISFFELAEPIAPFIEISGIAVTGIITLGMTIFSFTQITSLAWGAGWTKMVAIVKVASTAITTAIYSIPIIGWITLAVSALVGLGVYFYNTSAKARGFFWGVGLTIWEFVKGVGKAFLSLRKLITEVLNPLNWLQPQKYKNAFVTFASEMKDIGYAIGGAYSEGMEKGMANYRKNNSEKPTEQKTQLETLNKPTEIKPTSNNNGGGVYSSGSGAKSLGLSGRDSGGVRNITMNVTMNNSFSISGESDYRKISQRIKQEFIAIMTDASPAIS